MDFSNRVAVVTGSGSPRGIGRETIMELAKRGASLVVADMNYEGAKAVAAEAAEKYHVQALAVEVNITDETSVKAMYDTIDKTFHRLDILVNNAGITQPKATEDMTVDDFMKIITVNMLGTFLCSKYAVPLMKKNHYGRIVSLSSVSGKRGGGVYGGSHYSAAKAGILGFSKAFAREVVDYGVTVNCVCPGAIATDIRKGISDEKEAAIADGVPMHRVGTAKEVADTICFLASDLASYITGEDIDINGGSHMD